LFVDAEKVQIEAAAECGAPVIEIHTGHYADADSRSAQEREFKKIAQAVEHAISCGLQVNAGHGLHYHNVMPIAALTDIQELNIGHAIVARSVFTGLEEAVAEMKRLMVTARSSACR
jgi:pyridoxine 5-phosphate synthase